MSAPETFAVLGDTLTNAIYSGDRRDWLIALSVNRDSDALERSNWQVITDDLLARFEDDAAIERMQHWAVGWIDYLLVRPGSAAARAAIVWREKLDEYPVADEEAYSMLEMSEEWCVRCDRGMAQEHPLMDRHGNMCRFRSAEDVDTLKWRWAEDRKRAPMHGFRSTRPIVGGLWEGVTA